MHVVITFLNTDWRHGQRPLLMILSLQFHTAIIQSASRRQFNYFNPLAIFAFNRQYHNFAIIVLLGLLNWYVCTIHPSIGCTCGHTLARNSAEINAFPPACACMCISSAARHRFHVDLCATINKHSILAYPIPGKSGTSIKLNKSRHESSAFSGTTEPRSSRIILKHVHRHGFPTTIEISS